MKFYAIETKRTDTCCGSVSNEHSGVVRDIFAENEKDKAIRKCKALVRTAKWNLIKVYDYDEDEITIEKNNDETWFRVKADTTECEFFLTVLNWKK